MLIGATLFEFRKRCRGGIGGPTTPPNRGSGSKGAAVPFRVMFALGYNRKLVQSEISMTKPLCSRTASGLLSTPLLDDTSSPRRVNSRLAHVTECHSHAERLAILFMRRSRCLARNFKQRKDTVQGEAIIETWISRPHSSIDSDAGVKQIRTGHDKQLFNAAWDC